MTTVLALEEGYWSSLGEGVGAILLYALVGLVLVLAGFFAVDLTTPGKLRNLVAQGLPNAVTVSAAGMLSMAFIVVLAIYASGGDLAGGLIRSLIFGAVGIVVQVVSVRILERVLGIDIGAVLHSPTFAAEALVVSAAHFALGLVVAVAIL
ncbi:DUF350 domain-containing protein [Nocardia sp. NPDC127526]|uniref:DUF350 domain-containing protein n=1 Tax=Nocardia sp. NPDC127526 TaxID=3345393 RepID=UPI00363907ED